MTQILPLAPEDIPEKAAVHAQTWQETYRGLLPDELNDTITPQFAEDVTRRLTSLRTLVAKIDGRIVGYISWSDGAESTSASTARPRSATSMSSGSSRDEASAVRSLRRHSRASASETSC